MNFSDQITFVIFAFNEEARIERAVRNFIGTGRVIVVDNHSVDRTREIAERLGVTVLLHKNSGWVEDEHTAAIVKEAVQTPWIYWAFADEIVDSPTMHAILAAVEGDKYSIVSIVRKNYYYGRFLYNAYSSAQNRAFKKDSIDFTGNTIHKFGQPTVQDSEINYLDPKKFWIHHFISNTATQNLSSMNRYTEIEVENSSSLSATMIVLQFFRTILSNLIFKGAYKAGSAGFLYTMQMAFYNTILAVKAYERKHELTPASIEDRNNTVRDRLLREKIN